MPSKEKYLSKGDFQTELFQLQEEIRKSGARERKPEFSGARPALLVTDMQEYFLNPASHAFIPSAEAIIPNINRLIHHFEKNNYPVIFTQHLNTEEDALNMKTWWHDLIIPNSPQSSISPNLPIPQSSNPPIIIEKPQYDAFHHTDLEKILKGKGIDSLVICGVMTNLCCETTLRSAFVRGFKAFMPVDATAAYKRDHHISTFVNLSFGFSPLITTSEMIELTGK